MRIAAQICVPAALHHIAFYNNVCVAQLAQPFRCLGILPDAAETCSTRDWRWRYEYAIRRWRWLFDTIIWRGLIGIDIEDIYVQNPIMLMRSENIASTNDNQWYAISVRLSCWGELCTTKDHFGSNWWHGDTNGICLGILCASDFQETPHHDKSTFPLFPMLVFDKSMLNRCVIPPPVIFQPSVYYKRPFYWNVLVRQFSYLSQRRWDERRGEERSEEERRK